MSEKPTSDYAAAGVDTAQAEIGLSRVVTRIRATWPPADSLGAVQLDVGYYANVLDIGGIGLAITTDGVGSKVLIAEMVGRYETIGIDCVAMNVNDLLCVGARPLSLVDYIAIQDARPDTLDAIAVGLCEGARLAGISIPGGEIAQLPEVIQGVRPMSGVDLAGTAVGTVALDRIIIGRDVRAGDVLIGVESNGIHSNGLTLARNVLLGPAGYALDAPMPSGQRTLGEELLRPTHIYVREALELLDTLDVKAMMHITGDGFLNLQRVEAPVGFTIDALPPVPELFGMIQQSTQIADSEMYRVFNMGVGFCIVVDPAEVQRAIDIVQRHGKRAMAIGRAVEDPERRITILPAALVSDGKRFVPI